jgi:TPR repeat protein
MKQILALLIVVLLQANEVKSQGVPSCYTENLKKHDSMMCSCLDQFYGDNDTLYDAIYRCASFQFRRLRDRQKLGYTPEQSINFQRRIKKALDAKKIWAYAYMGDCYYYGIGVPQDYQQAFNYFYEGSQYNDPHANFGLGQLYLAGYAVPKDRNKAMEHLKKAADGGNNSARCMLGFIYAYRNDYQNAIFYFSQAAKNDDAGAMDVLGSFYQDGTGVPQDSNIAIYYFTRAAEKGNTNSMISLGRAYELGRGVKKDYTKAFQLYNLAAKSGDAAAMYILGIMYEKGKEVTFDLTSAIEWYKKGAQKGDEDCKKALERLGIKMN